MFKLLKIILRIIFIIAFLLVAIYTYNTQFVETKDVVSSAPNDTKLINIGGEIIAYSEINNNSSTTIIFVGGLSAWNGTWERVISESSKTHRNKYNYVAIDLPPFGFSTPSLENNYFRNTQAKRIAKFIEEKKIGSVILVGHSYGAGPLTEYAITNPGKVERLVLIDAVLNIDEPRKLNPSGPVQIDWLRNFALGTLVHIDPFAISQLKSFVFITDHVDQALLNIYTKYFSLDGVTNRLSAWLKDYINDPLTYTSNSSENYRNIPFPVRVIWGDKDTLTPISGTGILLETIPDVKLYTLINVGHIPMIEDYERFDSTLAEALEN